MFPIKLPVILLIVPVTFLRTPPCPALEPELTFLIKLPEILLIVPSLLKITPPVDPLFDIKLPAISPNVPLLL